MEHGIHLDDHQHFLSKNSNVPLQDQKRPAGNHIFLLSFFMIWTNLIFFSEKKSIMQTIKIQKTTSQTMRTQKKANMLQCCPLHIFRLSGIKICT